MNELEKLLDGIDPALKKYLDEYVEKTQVIAKRRLIAVSHELLKEFQEVKDELQAEHGMAPKDPHDKDDPDYVKIQLAEVWTSIAAAAQEVNEEFNAFMEQKLMEMLDTAMANKIGGPQDDEMEELRQLLRQTEADLEREEAGQEGVHDLLKNLPKPPKGDMN